MGLKGKAVGGGPGRALDIAETRRALAILADAQAGIELRALPAGYTRTLPGSAVDDLIQAAESFCEDALQVYWCVNPVPSVMAHAARVPDVQRRRWLFIDVDPLKPEGMEKESATDAEKEGTRQVAGDILDWLGQQGWPAPVLADSGNGTYLLYRIDLPASDVVRSAIKRVLHAVAAHCKGMPAVIDLSVHKANQLAKLPGSWARKGGNTAERPWRQAKLLHVPDVIECVEFEQITAVGRTLEEAVKPVAKGPPKGLKGKAAAPDGKAYARGALEREAGKLMLAPSGDRNNALNRAAFALGQLVAGGELERAEVEKALTLAASRAGLDQQEIGPTIASGIDSGMKSPRKAPERNGHAKASTLKPGDSVIILASRIAPKTVEWLWPGRIPLGKLTTFAGVGGLGKTFVLCDITARVTQGLDWPDSEGLCCDQGKVLFVSGEDDPDDTLVPRMIELGADLSRVAFLRTEVQDAFTLRDLDTLDRALDQLGPDTRFVAIDPPTAYLGGVDDHKNAELRQLLSPLKSWAAKRRVAIVFNTHVNKPQGAKVEAMMRVMGSVAWVNAVRAAHMFARDPDDRDRRLFVGMKLNIGKERKGLAYRIVAAGELARVEWLGEVDTTADEAVSQEGTRPRKVVASDWLVERFRERLEWPSNDLFRAASQEGISRDALFEAKNRLNLPRAKKITQQNGDVCWTWWVPADWPKLLTESVSPTVATVAPVESETF